MQLAAPVAIALLRPVAAVLEPGRILIDNDPAGSRTPLGN
jgi:hypothetical protein